MEVAAASASAPPPGLQVLLIELQCVRARFCVGDGAWLLQCDAANDMISVPGLEGRGEVPVWEHEDIIIRYPSLARTQVEIVGAWVLAFDGAC